jgi:hypothetical protein
MLALIRAWLKRRRARLCAQGLHALIEEHPAGRPRLVITRCRHCPVTYRTFK